MKHLAFAITLGQLACCAFAVEPASRADRELTEYFRVETGRLAERCLDEEMLNGWKANRDEYRRQLQDMLGLWPMPERTELNATITGKIEHDEFTVENLHFQAMPGLYVTANLYVPKSVRLPAPAILYECGHWRLVTNGVSLGNKAVYQSDGAWYARNGYVCLVLDTVLAGEIQGIHTGTRDHGLWWWNSRGYTPAGVEAWLGIRALDYLSTRAEVDPNRIGITGHSGGGAYSWMVTALDDRIAAAAPLAGMADIQAHIGDGVIDSHCDCNFFINIYRWDFPQVAALAAPRPLLMGGTDSDRIFPLDNTLRIHEKVRHVYQRHNALTRLGLIIAPGPHDETPELRLAALRWFNRHLKGEDAPVKHTAERLFPPQALKVFEALPAGAINTNIAETFVGLAESKPVSSDELRAALREKVFSAWPAEPLAMALQQVFSAERNGVRLTAWDFDSQPGVRLRFYVLESATTLPSTTRLTVLDDRGWTHWLASVSARFSDELHEERGGTTAADAAQFERLKETMTRDRTALAFFAPRGVGLTQWTGDTRALTKIRRRFMLLGQTLDGMRVWDIRRAFQVLRETGVAGRAPLEVCGNGPMAANALYATLFDPSPSQLRLSELPPSHLEGPDYLGVLRITDIAQVLAVVREHAQVDVEQ